MLKFTLRQLEYFAKVAETGSLATAAKALNISQPSISSAIAKLEDSMGIQLLVRHHAQGVTLTSAGGRMLLQIRDLLAHADDVRNRAQGLGENVEGRIHIGCFGPIASMYIPSLLTQFKSDYPHIELLIYEENIDTLLDGLGSNRYDVSIVYRLGVPESLRVESLTSLRPHVILPEGHALASRRSVSLQALAAEPMVLLDTPQSREYFLSLFADQGLEPRVSIRSPSFESVRALVANGAGYSILLTRPVTSSCYDGHRLVVRSIDNEVSSVDIVLVRPNGVRPTRLVNTFVEQCQNHFAAFQSNAAN
ncbi:MAG: LysR family transcriptional regulator [Pseudomonadota bacterium]